MNAITCLELIKWRKGGSIHARAQSEKELEVTYAIAYAIGTCTHPAVQLAVIANKGGNVLTRFFTRSLARNLQ